MKPTHTSNQLPSHHSGWNMLKEGGKQIKKTKTISHKNKKNQNKINQSRKLGTN